MSAAPARRNPFPGLRPFTQEEDYLFFGREEQTLELLERLARHRFLAVVGTSGSGKSSLVRCGLLSQLLGGTMLVAGAAWAIAVTHPGGNPLALLTDALLDAGLYLREDEHARENLLATLSRSHFGLVEAVSQAGLDAGTNFLLVVDQFEEIFRFHEAGQMQQEAANEFVSLLLEGAAQPEVPIYVVLTMRSDFIGECGQFEGLAERVNRGEFLIPRLNRAQYKRVIEGPIKVAGGTITPRLLQRLLNDLGQQADQLPCLQHALMRTWDVWASNGNTEALDLEDYQRVGKMAQALSHHADEIYEALASARQRALCQGMFQALTVEETNSRGIRRSQRLGRLCHILEVAADELRPIIDAYRQSGVTFLMPSPEVALTDQTIIDISHESLMRVWTRLRQWVVEETQAAGIYRRLAESAALRAQGKAGLYRDPELGIALAWRESKRPNAAWAERYRTGFAAAMEFLEASRQARVVEEQAREAARRRELAQAQQLAEAQQLRLEQQQRSAHKLRWMITGLAVVALVAGLACVAALVANKRANNERDRANNAQQEALLERDKSRQLSANLALDKAVALAEAGQADRSLLWMLEALKTAPQDAEGFRRMIRWNLGAWLGQVHKPLRFIDLGGDGNWCDFSPDGRSFAAGGSAVFPGDISRPIGLWDTASGRKLSILPGAFAPCAFRPDGKALVAYADLLRMVAIDLATGRVLWTTPQLPGQSPGRIDFSYDGSTVLAVRGDNAGRQWLCRLNVLTGKECGEPLRGWTRMAVAPGGKLAAAGRTENGEAYIDLVDLPSDRRTASWRADAPALQQLLFSPDGKSLYVSAREPAMSKGDDFFGRIWALGAQKAASPLMAHTAIGGYTPSADRLVTVSENLLVVRDATGGVRGSGFPIDYYQHLIPAGPDGRTILALASNSTACLWEISAEAEPVPDKLAPLRANSPSPRLRGFYGFGGDLCADGQIAASQSLDTAGRELARLSDPVTCRPIGAPARHHPGWVVRAFACSPDGRCFATGSHPPHRVTGELRLWDTSTGRLLFPPMPHTNWVSAIAFHPDGKLVATGDYSGLVRTWDLSTGREIGRPLFQREIVLAVSFSPDGKMLAVGLASDRTGKPGTRLWDATTRQPIGELLPSTDYVTRIVFRPDGRALLAGTNNRSTRLWDTIQGQALTEPLIDEWPGGFRQDGRAFLTVGGDGTIKLRDATTGEVLGRFLSAPSPANCAAFRGDDGLVAAGFEDGAVRLYDPATNGPVGPPRAMRHAVHKVAFTSDGRLVVAVDELGESCTWPVPEPLDGNLDDLTLRIEARTGLRMETGLALSRLNPAAWQERLEQLGRLDPTAALADTDSAWHAPLVREAEQHGNAFAALWHLDRLLAARPDDWLLYARRGRAWSLSDQFDRAADDFQNAERLSSRDQVLDFQTHCVLDCTKAERWAVALWYLDRLLAVRPKDGSLHLDRAAVYGKLGREADRQAELTRVFELGADEGVVLPRAEELGRAGRWSEAASLLAGCGRRGPLSQQLAQAWAIACLQAKDYAGYREACAADLACQGSDPTIVWNALSAASVFALAAKGLDDYRVPIGWIESRLSAVPAPSPVWKHDFLNALGGLLLRAGRLDEAIVRINEGIAAAKDAEAPTDWTYLALAHARKGKLLEARQALERFRDWRPDSSLTFWELQEIALLRSEAEALVGHSR